MFRNLVIALALVASGCASTSNLSIQGKVYLKADDFVKSAGLLQNTAIALNSQNVISEADTRLVVVAVKASVQTVKALPSGWKVTVNSGLDNLSNSLSGAAKQKLDPLIASAKTVLTLVP